MPSLLERMAFKGDLLLRRAVDRARVRWYRRPFSSFGPLEALLFGRQVDFWCRSARVLSRLLAAVPAGGAILDVGSGREGLRAVVRLAGLEGRWRILPSDLSSARLRDGVAASATALPFADGRFDAAVAMDMLEHVPAPLRRRVLDELRRVARRCVVVTLPIRDAAGRFDGEGPDRRFHAWHLRTHGYPEGNTAEHLRVEYPRLEEFLSQRPSRVEPLCGNTAWTAYMRLAHRPWTWLAAGLFYWLRGRAADRMPPHHSCLLEWRRA